ncbi:hypothetical protein [Nocardia sp. NPDC047038]
MEAPQSNPSRPDRNGTVKKWLELALWLRTVTNVVDLATRYLPHVAENVTASPAVKVTTELAAWALHAIIGL